MLRWRQCKGRAKFRGRRLALRCLLDRDHEGDCETFNFNVQIHFTTMFTKW